MLFLHFRILISYRDLYCDILIVSHIEDNKEERMQNFDPKEQLLRNHILWKWGKERTTFPILPLRIYKQFLFCI